MGSGWPDAVPPGRPSVERPAYDAVARQASQLEKGWLTMQCNIDNRGRQARMITGAITAAVGVGLVMAARLGALPPWALWAGVGCLAGGAFSIFEGVKGWCVVRALGFKTPM